MAGARQIRDEIMRMTISVNSDPAQTAIYELSKKTQELKEEEKELKEEMKEVAKTSGKTSQEYQDLAKEAQRVRDEIKRNADEMERLRGEMDISQMTMAQLKKEASLLRAQLNNMVPGTEASRALQEQLQRVNDRMAEVRNGARSTSFSFSELAEKFNHYSGIITAVAAVLVGFGVSVQQVIDKNNKMADAMSGVEKTTGLAKKEVQELTRAFSDFDTRTSKVDLLKIAESGGRLGVAKDQIQDFVREVDKANVALGDSWSGGASKIAEELGKVTTLYKQTAGLPIAESINKVGSALNELAADGAASEQNINEFALRVGALPDKLKPTIAEAMGLGAAFEESGIDAERAGTAYGNLISTAAKSTDKFAYVMKMTQQQVKDLINTNPTEFFLKFSEGLKGMDATDLAATLEYLKLNDQYVKSLLGSASEKTDRFRQQIDLANKSMQEGISLQDEFNKVNNNAAAIWEKVQRKIAESITAAGVAKYLNGMIEAFGKFIGVVEDSTGTVTDFRETLFLMFKIIAVATTVTLSYNAGLALTRLTLTGTREQLLAYTIVQKLNNLLTQVGTSLQAAWNLIAGTGIGIVGNLTRSTVLQTAAQQRLNAAMTANPFGAILAVVGLVISAYIAFGQETDKVVKKQMVLNDVRKQSADAIAKEKSEVESLLATARNENLSKEQRIDAIKRLNAISPQYLGNLTLENIKTREATEAVNQYVQALNKKAMAEAFQAKRTEMMKKLIDESNKQLSDYAGFGGKTGQKVEQFVNGLVGPKKLKEIDFNWWDKLSGEAQSKAFKNYDYTVQKAILEHNKAINSTKDEIDALNKMEQDFLKNNPDVMSGGGTSNYNVPTEGEKKSTGKKTKNTRSSDNRSQREEERHKREMEDMMRRGEEAAQLARQIELDIEDAKIEAMKEGYDKEIDQLNLQEQRKMAELDKKKIGTTDISVLQGKIDKAKGDDKILFQALMKSWLDNNAELENLKNEQQKVFDFKRKALQYKSEQEWLKDQQDEHRIKIGQLQREFNEELAGYQSFAALKNGLRGRISDQELANVTTWEEGKQALQKVYNKQEIAMQVAHLETMMRLYEGIDLSVLNDKQRQEVLNFIEEAKNKIAELNAVARGEDEAGKKEFASVGKETKYDIFGLNQDDWVNMINNIQQGTNALSVMQSAVTALSNAFTSYYAAVEANEKKQLQQMTRNAESKKKSLKNQLDSGLINQETYKKETIKIDRDLDKKKAEMEYKSARRQRNLQIAQAIAGTAMMVINAANTQPFMPVGLAMMALAGIAGAFQIATILNTPLPSAEGYESGFNMLSDEYPIEREQDGRKFTVRQKRLQSGLVHRPTHFIAGERGVEMVIDQPTWTSYSPELKNAIYTANARAKGFEAGFNMLPKDAPKNPDNDEMMAMNLQLLRENRELLQELRDYGIKAYIEKNARNGKEVHEMQKEYLDLNNKNKH